MTEPHDDQPSFEPPDPAQQPPPPGPDSAPPPYGGPPPGQPPYGEPQPGQPSYGGPQPGQPPYGGGQPGQPPYGGQQPGPPPSAGPPYGAPQGGPPAYGGSYGGPPAYGPYGAPPARGPYGPPGSGITSADDTTWSLLAYLGQFAVGFIAPLVVYLARKDQSPFVRFHGAQALNLALTGLIVFFGGLVLGLVTLGFGFIITLPVMIALGITHVVYVIIASIRVGRRELYRIPAWLCWPMVR